MVEQQRQRVEQEMSKMIEQVDKEFLRKIQADMHRCAIKCCENNALSLDGIQKCVENCSQPLNKAQNYVQSEFEGLQSRLQRCVMDCNDTIRDKIGPNPQESDVNRYTAMFDSCAIKCVDKHIELIPTIMKAMRTVLSKQQGA